jgi:hypothetical protein
MAVDHRKGGPKRVREEEVRAAITATKSDRLPLSRRLKALEDNYGLAATGPAKITNNRQGFATRVADIEQA